MGLSDGPQGYKASRCHWKGYPFAIPYHRKIHCVPIFSYNPCALSACPHLRRLSGPLLDDLGIGGHHLGDLLVLQRLAQRLSPRPDRGGGGGGQRREQRRDVPDTATRGRLGRHWRRAEADVLSALAGRQVVRSGGILLRLRQQPRRRSESDCDSGWKILQKFNTCIRSCMGRLEGHSLPS